MAGRKTESSNWPGNNVAFYEAETNGKSMPPSFTPTHTLGLRFAKDARLRKLCARRVLVDLCSPPSATSAPLFPATLIVSENPPQAAATIALYPPLPRRPRGILYMHGVGFKF